MVNDPLGFGNLPTQQSGPGGVVVQPKPRSIIPLPPPVQFNQAPEPIAVNFDRPLPPYQVEDRIQYWQAQDQIREQKLAAAQAELDRITRLQNLYVNPVRRAYQQAPTLLEQQQTQPVQDTSGLSDAERQIYEAQRANNVQFNQTPGVGLTGLASTIGQGLTQEIPGAQQVADVAGNIGNRIGTQAASIAEGPLGPLAERYSPVSPQAVGGAVTGFAAETLIPTEVWQAALELVPGIGSVPELTRAVREGAPEAISALTRAGEKLGAREEVQKGLSAIGSESGALKIPFRKTETQAIAPEVQTALKRRGMEIDQASWDKLPPINREIITDMAQAAITGKQRQELLAAGRAKQVGAITQAATLEGKSFAERQAIASKNMEGTILPTFKPLGEKTILNELGEETPKYGATELTQLSDQIDRAMIDGKISPFQWKQAGPIFKNLMEGGKELEPGQRKLMGKIFGPEFEAAIPAGKNWDAWREATGVIGIPQGLASTFDWSAVLRQMAPLGFSNPREYAQAVSTIKKATLSDRGAMEVMEQTLKQPWVTTAPYPEAEGLSFADVGGRMSDIGGHLHESEGQFSALNNSLATRTLEKLPWVKPSERAFNVPINVLRSNVYSRYAQAMWDSGERDPKMYKRVADVIDHATGWSNIKVGQLTSGFNAFFSPRNFAARFQVMLDPIVQPGSLFKPSARQLAARNLVGFVGANAALLGAMAGSGALAAKTLGIPNPVHVELDPRSTDMWKGRIGNTRVDFTGGYGSIIRLVSRLAPLATGNAPQIKNSYGEIVDASPSQLIDDFIAGKLGPIPKEIWTAMGFPGGQQYANDFTTKEGIRTAAYNMLTPFFTQDVVEAWRKQSPGVALATAPLAFLGAGVNTYESPNVAIDKVVMSDPATAQYQHYRDLPNDVKGEFNKRHPDEVKALQQSHEDAGRATFDTITNATNQGLADLGSQLRSGQLEPADYRQQAGDFVHQQAIKFQQAIIDTGLDQRDLKGDPKLLNDFFTSIDGATNQTTGQTDFDKQATLEDQYRATLTPEQNQRLDQMLSYSSDDTYHALKQAKTTLAQSGYYDRSQAAFDDWKSKIQNPDKDQWQTPDDLKRWAMNKTVELGGPEQYYTGNPVWKGWQKTYDLNNKHFLVENPKADALAAVWGYQDRIHSPEAAKIYTDMTGKPAPVPRN